MVKRKTVLGIIVILLAVILGDAPMIVMYWITATRSLLYRYQTAVLLV